MCKLGVISQERLKIKAKLLLSANIGSHIYAASIGDSVTLNGRFTHRALSLR